MTGIVSQGTQLYILDPTDVGNEVRELTNIRSIGESTVSRSKIDITHLKSAEKEYLLGLAERASFPVGFNYDPQDASYQRMKVIEGGGAVRMVMGLSDGVSDPTYVANVYTLPTTRTWIDYNALIEAVNRGNAEVDGALQGTYTIAPTGGEAETAKI